MGNRSRKIIICGDTRHPLSILDTLFDKGSQEVYTIHEKFIPKQTNFLVISKDMDLIKSCNNKFTEILTVFDDASDDEVLITNGIKSAHAIVVSYSDDRENLLVILSIRQLNPRIKIIATCSTVETMRPKLIRAGANSVISPSTIDGSKMASMLIRPHTIELLESFLRRDDNQFSAQEIYITNSDQNRGCTIKDSEYAKVDLLIIAISRDDSDDIIYNPVSTRIIKEGDILLVLGTIPNFHKLSPYTQYHLKDIEIDNT